MRRFLLTLTALFIVCATTLGAHAETPVTTTSYRGAIDEYQVLIVETGDSAGCTTEFCSVTLCPSSDPACAERRFPVGTIVAFPQLGQWVMSVPPGVDPILARDRLNQAVKTVFDTAHRTDR